MSVLAYNCTSIKAAKQMCMLAAYKFWIMWNKFQMFKMKL